MKFALKSHLGLRRLRVAGELPSHGFKLFKGFYAARCIQGCERSAARAAKTKTTGGVGRLNGTKIMKNILLMAITLTAALNAHASPTADPGRYSSRAALLRPHGERDAPTMVVVAQRNLSTKLAVVRSRTTPMASPQPVVVADYSTKKNLRNEPSSEFQIAPLIQLAPLK